MSFPLELSMVQKEILINGTKVRVNVPESMLKDFGRDA